MSIENIILHFDANCGNLQRHVKCSTNFAGRFGTPVAISAAMLIGLGYKLLKAATIALIGNTAPVASGALRTPIVALADVTGLPILELSAMVGRQLPFFSIIVPFWLVWAMAGRRATTEVWPACLVLGGSFAIVQFLVSNYHGPWLVEMVAAIVSILPLVVLLKVWKPVNTWRFSHDEVEYGEDGAVVPNGKRKCSGSRPCTFR